MTDREKGEGLSRIQTHQNFFYSLRASVQDVVLHYLVHGCLVDFLCGVHQCPQLHYPSSNHVEERSGELRLT